MSELDECKCNLRTKLVGDGCQYCNPELVAEIDAEDARKYRELLPMLEELCKLRLHVSKGLYGAYERYADNGEVSHYEVLCGESGLRLAHEVDCVEHAEFIAQAANITTRIKEVLEG